MKKAQKLSSNRERNRATMELIKKGSATSREIFAATFGVSEIPDLDQSGLNDRPIEIVATWFIGNEPKHKLTIPDSVIETSTRWQWLMNAWNVVARRIDKARQFSFNPLGLGGNGKITINKCLISPLTRGIIKPIDAADVLVHEQAHVLQGFNGTFKHKFGDAFRVHRPLHDESRSSSQNKKYLREDWEIQARIATILSRTVHNGFAIPQNRKQLWALLITCGLEAPMSIHDELKNKHDPDRSVLDMYRGFRNLASYATIHDHAVVMNSIPLEQEYFWREVMPYMAGELLYLYGDPNGLRKFGYTGAWKGRDPIRLHEAKPTVKSLVLEAA